MQLKVVYNAGIFPPDIGGPAGYVPLMASEFVKRGDEVCVICYSDVAEHSKDQQYSFKVVRIKRSTFILLRELITLFILFKEAKNADVIYSNGNDFKSFIISKILSIPAVHKIVGDTSWERACNKGWYRGTIDEYQKDSKKLVLKITDWIRSYPLKKASLVITPSHYLAQIVQGWGVPDTKIQIIYNAFSPAAQSDVHQFVPKKKRFRLITICRLVVWKHVDNLIKLLCEDSEIELMIVGDGPLKENLISLAESLNVFDRIIFTGRLEKAQIPLYLKSSDIFVLNSTYEGLPHVILEAFESQVPVIATAVGGTPEVIQDKQTGVLVPPLDNKSLLIAIKKIKTDESFKQKISLNALKLLQSKFSLKTMKDKTYQAIHKQVKTNNRFK